MFLKYYTRFNHVNDMSRTGRPDTLSGSCLVIPGAACIPQSIPECQRCVRTAKTHVNIPLNAFDQLSKIIFTPEAMAKRTATTTLAMNTMWRKEAPIAAEELEAKLAKMLVGSMITDFFVEPGPEEGTLRMKLSTDAPDIEVDLPEIAGKSQRLIYACRTIDVIVKVV